MIHSENSRIKRDFKPLLDQGYAYFVLNNRKTTQVRNKIRFLVTELCSVGAFIEFGYKNCPFTDVDLEQSKKI